MKLKDLISTMLQPLVPSSSYSALHYSLQHIVAKQIRLSIIHISQTCNYDDTDNNKWCAVDSIHINWLKGVCVWIVHATFIYGHFDPTQNSACVCVQSSNHMHSMFDFLLLLLWFESHFGYVCWSIIIIMNGEKQQH